MRGDEVDTYTVVKNRILMLLEENRMSIHKLATLSTISASTIKSILYGNSKNPGVVTIKLLCDGFGITLREFFDADCFDNLE